MSWQHQNQDRVLANHSRLALLPTCANFLRNNENTSDPNDGTFYSPQSDNTVQAPEVRFINEEQANLFIQMLNDRSVSQLSFVISASVEQKDSISSSE